MDLTIKKEFNIFTINIINKETELIINNNNKKIGVVDVLLLCR